MCTNCILKTNDPAIRINSLVNKRGDLNMCLDLDKHELRSKTFLLGFLTI